MGRAGDDLAWAWRHLGAARTGLTIVQKMDAGQRVEAIPGQNDPEILELVAMSLGFGNVMTALDICADSAILIGGEPPMKPKGPRGGFYDLGDLRELQGRLSAPPAIGAWVDQLLAQTNLKLLKTCRDALTHRQVRQHLVVRWEDGRAIRALAEITPLDSGGVVRNLGSIGELVPRLVGFGEEQLEGLCHAILTPSEQ